MKLLKNESRYLNYIQNSPFGKYYIPARFQYVILKDYYKKIKQDFTLPQGEAYFSKKKIRLNTLINGLKKNDNLILISIFMFPENKKNRLALYKKLINKRVRVHFIFESRVIQNKNDYSKIENIFKLQKFTN
jgi:sporadic carbohydrate cluster protein (TIGR04323 family)